MFKNRLRTAALAGAVAIATGISGLAVPAMAQTANNGNHFNQEDGSAPQAGVNQSEKQLKAAVDKITEFLEDEQEDRSVVRADYLDLFASKNPNDVLDPSEQAAKEAFDARYAQVTAQLATASKNVADARASVRFALDADEAAVAAYDALDSYMGNLSAAQIEEINALIATVNAENETSVADLTELSFPSNAQEALRLEVEVQTHRLNAGNHPISDAEGDYVTRDYILALDALEANTDVAEAFDLVGVARAAAEESQRSDVLVRQLLLAHANAQVNALRAVQADYSVVARYADLYENDAAFEDQAGGWTSLRQTYLDTLEVTGTAVTENLDKLTIAETAVEDGFKAWETDLVNTGDDGEYEAYLVERRAFAQNVYDNLIDNGTWQNAVALVNALDNKFSNESAAAAEEEAKKQAEEAKKAAEEAEAERKAEADRLAQILEELAKQNDNTPAPEEPSVPAGSTGSSENTGIIGLIAAIGGIIGLIAVGFPFIQDFLR